MRKLLPICILLLFSCQNNKQISDYEIYDLLNICFENYYLNYDIDITASLNKFENHLLIEGHLKDTSGIAYKELFRKLDSDLYFNPPLEFNDFNEVILLKNPMDILACAIDVFSIDSSQVLSTNYAEVTEKIHREISEKEEVSIHFFFKTYRENLSPKEIKSPYIKQSILLLLYRWYYKSKYDREIPLDIDTTKSLENNN